MGGKEVACYPPGKLGVLGCILAWFLTASIIFAKILEGGSFCWGEGGNPRAAPPPLYETLNY